MKTTTPLSASVLCAIALTFAAGAARADADGASPSDAPVAMSALTRAEVLADLECWRESGMAAFTPGEAGIDPMSAPYRTALAKYDTLRSGPAFAQRVVRIARARGEAIDVATNR